jgi:hypothetical protein
MSFVYFAKHPRKAIIKIGMSEAPRLRTREIKGKPRLLGLLRGGREREKMMHRKFKSLALGYEWFKDDPTIRAYIKSSGAEKLLSKCPDEKAILMARIPAWIVQAVQGKAERENRQSSVVVTRILGRYFESPEKAKEHDEE